MFKYIIAAIGAICLCGVFFLLTGCGIGMAKEFVVGKDISITDIEDFYYTIDASTNPPQFQRYRFFKEAGKPCFYHEKREGNTWPLREKHITKAGTLVLTDTQWKKFYSLLENGKVTKRKENASAGGSGPWLYIYWSKDKDVYQVFEFATATQKNDFERFCVDLVEKK